MTFIVFLSLLQFVIAGEFIFPKKKPVLSKEILENNLEKPLSSIPDPYGEFKSYADHNNNLLRNFLDRFNFLSFSSDNKVIGGNMACNRVI